MKVHILLQHPYPLPPTPYTRSYPYPKKFSSLNGAFIDIIKWPLLSIKKFLSVVTLISLIIIILCYYLFYYYLLPPWPILQILPPAPNILSDLKQENFVVVSSSYCLITDMAASTDST